jgi:uncharacterized protein YjbI with pentapeptide repeats
MSTPYFEEKKFDKRDFSIHPLPAGEYESCSFTSCNFSSVDIGSITFIDCLFTGCNLSTVKTVQTTFRDITFKECKLLGIHFENCIQFLFSVSFEDCVLNHSSFYQMQLKKTLFKKCMMQEIDFTEADLSNAVLEKCDLSKTLFDRSILEKADFRTSFNYSIDPERNRIKKAKFSTDGIAGLLDKYDIQIS